MRLGVHHEHLAVGGHGRGGQVQLAVGLLADAAPPGHAEILGRGHVLDPLVRRAERLGPSGDRLGVGQVEGLAPQRLGDLECLVECDQRNALAFRRLDLVLVGLVEGIDLADRFAAGEAKPDQGQGRERKGRARFH